VDGEQTMMIGQGHEYIRIEERERVPATLPCPGDVRVEVTVRLQDFGGTYSRIWLSKPDLVRFTKDLEAVLTLGTGRACLEAMSPEEFRLQLEPRTHGDTSASTSGWGVISTVEKSTGPYRSWEVSRLGRGNYSPSCLDSRIS
jgi:hypothetical protein